MTTKNSTKPGKVIHTRDLNDVFSDIVSEKLPAAYEKARNYLLSLDIECVFYENQDFKDIELLDPANPVYDLAQCRVHPLSEDVDEYQRKFDRGEPLRWAPIGVQFGTEAALAFGNTRYGGKVKSRNSCGPYIVADPDNELKDYEKITILSELAAFSNAKEKYHQVPDTMLDVAKQAGQAWALIKQVVTDGTDKSKVTAEHRTWKSKWDAASDKEAFRRQEWFPQWMQKTKGNTQFTSKQAQSRIYNIAFKLNKKNDSTITEFTDEQLKSRYNTKFGDSGWNTEEKCIDQNQMGSEWQFEHLWGTKEGKTGTNCVNNLRNYILRTLYIRDKHHVFDSVSVIIKGDSGASDVLIKNHHIQQVLDMATTENKRPARVKQGVPIIDRFLFPQMFRNINNKQVDRDYAYKWDREELEYVEVGKPAQDIEHTKQCSTCKKVKAIDEFGICNSKGIKDGWQPQCKTCGRAYARNYKRKIKHPTESIGMNGR